MTSLAFCLVLIPALIVAVLAVSEAEPKGDWAPQPALAGLAEAYGTTTFSWDIAESREVCARYTVPLNANPGVTDHGKVISAAVRLVALNGGGSVALEPGVYTIKSRVKLLSNVCLRGSGVAQTVLRAPTGGGGKDLKDGLIRADYLKFVAVQNLTVDGGTRPTNFQSNPNRGRYGVHFRLSNFAWISDVVVRGFAGSGLFMRGDGLRWTYHVAVHNSELRGNGIDGLRLAQTHFASVAGTTSAANGQHGLSVEGARATLLSENAFAGNGGLSGRGCGVMVQSVDELHPRALYAWGNNMTGAPRAGVCIKAGYDINLNRTRIVNTRDRKATCFDVEHQSFGETNGVCSVLSKKEYRVYPLKMKPRCPGRGIMSGKVCCERTCRKCGGKGCQRRGPNSSCCYSTVQKMNRPCKKFSPPCVM